MIDFDLDISCVELTNEEVYYEIDRVISSYDINGEKIERIEDLFLHIGESIKYITDEHLLELIIDYIRNNNRIKNEDEVKENLDFMLKKSIYSHKDKIRIKAFVYSTLIEQDVNISFYENHQMFKGKPKLIFLDFGRVISSNLDEIFKYLKKKTLNDFLSKNASLPPNAQKTAINSVVLTLKKNKFEKGTNSLDNEIEYLEALRDDILDGMPQVKTLKDIPKAEILDNINPHPRIFKSVNAFKLFEMFLSFVENDLADYSFIYRKMVADGLMYNIRDIEFRDWLDKNYNVAIDKTKTLENCSPPLKVKLYNILKERFEPYNILGT